MEELRELTGDAGYASYAPLTRAHREVCHSGPHAWLRREIINPAAIKAGSDETNLDIGEYTKVESLWVAAAASTQRRWTQICETVPSEFENRVVDYRDANGSDEVGRPLWFKIEESRIRWLPTPEDDYDLKIQVVLSAGTVEPGAELLVPDEYAFIVPLLAAGDVLALRADPESIHRGNIFRKRGNDAMNKLTRNTAPSRGAYWDRPTQEILR